MSKKIISISLIVCLLLPEISHAAETVSPAMAMSSALERLISSPDTFKTPTEFCDLKEVHTAGARSDKLIIHIQDAHCNLSGQKNLAGTLDSIMDRYRVSLVLSEGGEGDCSLTSLKSLASPNIWKRVANQFLMEGKIQGEEYLNLTSDHPMRIIGMENGDLYEKSVQNYSRLAGQRQAALEYLSLVNVAIAKIKNKTYPASLLQYEKNKRRMAEDGTDSVYLGGLLEIGRMTQVQSSFFSEMYKLELLQQEEKSIDFESAQLELVAFMGDLAKRGGAKEVESAQKTLLSSKNKQMNHASSIQTLLEAARTKQISLLPYPHLISYGEYLEQFSKMDLGLVFEEMARFEEEVYQALLSSADAKLTHAIDRYLRLLGIAYRIQMTASDFEEFKTSEPDFATASYLAFINTKLVELGYARDIVPYENTFEAGKTSLEAFYDSVAERDLAFVAHTEKALENEKQKAAVLITGGYHTAHLRKLFEAKGYSWLVLSPRVTSATNQKKYEELLLGENFPSTKKVQIENGRIQKSSGVRVPLIGWQLFGGRLAELIAAARLAERAGSDKRTQRSQSAHTATLTPWIPTNLSGIGSIFSDLTQTLIASWIRFINSGIVFAWVWQPLRLLTDAINISSSSLSIMTINSKLGFIWSSFSPENIMSNGGSQISPGIFSAARLAEKTDGRHQPSDEIHGRINTAKEWVVRVEGSRKFSGAIQWARKLEKLEGGGILQGVFEIQKFGKGSEADKLASAKRFVRLFHASWRLDGSPEGILPKVSPHGDGRIRPRILKKYSKERIEQGVTQVQKDLLQRSGEREAPVVNVGKPKRGSYKKLKTIEEFKRASSLDFDLVASLEYMTASTTSPTLTGSFKRRQFINFFLENSELFRWDNPKRIKEVYINSSGNAIQGLLFTVKVLKKVGILPDDFTVVMVAHNNLDPDKKAKIEKKYPGHFGGILFIGDFIKKAKELGGVLPQDKTDAELQKELENINTLLFYLDRYVKRHNAVHPGSPIAHVLPSNGESMVLGGASIARNLRQGAKRLGLGEADMILEPLGGGGPIAGAAIEAYWHHERTKHKTRVVGVTSSIPVSALADGMAIPSPQSEAVEMQKAMGSDAVVFERVPEEYFYKAWVELQDAGYDVEPTSAAPLAYLYWVMSDKNKWHLLKSPDGNKKVIAFMLSGANYSRETLTHARKIYEQENMGGARYLLEKSPVAARLADTAEKSLDVQIHSADSANVSASIEDGVLRVANADPVKPKEGELELPLNFFPDHSFEMYDQATGRWQVFIWHGSGDAPNLRIQDGKQRMYFSLGPGKEHRFNLSQIRRLLDWGRPEDHEQILFRFRVGMTQRGWPLGHPQFSDGEEIEVFHNRVFSVKTMKYLAGDRSVTEYYNDVFGLDDGEHGGINDHTAFTHAFGIVPGGVQWFRSPKQIEKIVEIVNGLPQDKAVNIRVHACWNGEEAYGIALTLKKNFPNRKFNIVASDIHPPNPNELNWLMESQVPDELIGEIDTYFDRGPQGALSLKKDFLDFVNFRQADITKSNPADKRRYDIVIANNVLGQSMIDKHPIAKGKKADPKPELIAVALENILASLNPGGYLLVDNSHLSPLGEKKRFPEAVQSLLGSQLLRSVGEGVYQKPSIPRGVKRWWLWIGPALGLGFSLGYLSRDWLGADSATPMALVRVVAETWLLLVSTLTAKLILDSTIKKFGLHKSLAFPIQLGVVVGLVTLSAQIFHGDWAGASITSAMNGTVFLHLGIGLAGKFVAAMLVKMKSDRREYGAIHGWNALQYASRWAVLPSIVNRYVIYGLVAPMLLGSFDNLLIRAVIGTGLVSVLIGMPMKILLGASFGEKKSAQEPEFIKNFFKSWLSVHPFNFYYWVIGNPVAFWWAGDHLTTYLVIHAVLDFWFDIFFINKVHKDFTGDQSDGSPSKPSAARLAGSPLNYSAEYPSLESRISLPDIFSWGSSAKSFWREISISALIIGWNFMTMIPRVLEGGYRMVSIKSWSWVRKILLDSMHFLNKSPFFNPLRSTMALTPSFFRDLTSLWLTSSSTRSLSREISGKERVFSVFQGFRGEVKRGLDVLRRESWVVFENLFGSLPGFQQLKDNVNGHAGSSKAGFSMMNLWVAVNEVFDRWFHEASIPQNLLSAKTLRAPTVEVGGRMVEGAGARLAETLDSSTPVDTPEKLKGQVTFIKANRSLEEILSVDDMALLNEIFGIQFGPRGLGKFDGGPGPLPMSFDKKRVYTKFDEWLSSNVDRMFYYDGRTIYIQLDEASKEKSGLKVIAIKGAKPFVGADNEVLPYNDDSGAGVVPNYLTLTDDGYLVVNISTENDFAPKGAMSPDHAKVEFDEMGDGRGGSAYSTDQAIAWGVYNHFTYQREKVAFVIYGLAEEDSRLFVDNGDNYKRVIAIQSMKTWKSQKLEDNEQEELLRAYGRAIRDYHFGSQDDSSRPPKFHGYPQFSNMGVRKNPDGSFRIIIRDLNTTESLTSYSHDQRAQRRLVDIFDILLRFRDEKTIQTRGIQSHRVDGQWMVRYFLEGYFGNDLDEDKFSALVSNVDISKYMSWPKLFEGPLRASMQSQPKGKHTATDPMCLDEHHGTFGELYKCLRSLPERSSEKADSSHVDSPSRMASVVENKKIAFSGSFERTIEEMIYEKIGELKKEVEEGLGKGDWRLFKRATILPGPLAENAHGDLIALRVNELMFGILALNPSKSENVERGKRVLARAEQELYPLLKQANHSRTTVFSSMEEWLLAPILYLMNPKDYKTLGERVVRYVSIDTLALRVALFGPHFRETFIEDNDDDDIYLIEIYLREIARMKGSRPLDSKVAALLMGGVFVGTENGGDDYRDLLGKILSKNNEVRVLLVEATEIIFEKKIEQLIKNPPTSLPSNMVYQSSDHSDSVIRGLDLYNREHSEKFINLRSIAMHGIPEEISFSRSTIERVQDSEIKKSLASLSDFFKILNTNVQHQDLPLSAARLASPESITPVEGPAARLAGRQLASSRGVQQALSIQLDLNGWDQSEIDGSLLEFGKILNEVSDPEVLAIIARKGNFGYTKLNMRNPSELKGSLTPSSKISIFILGGDESSREKILNSVQINFSLDSQLPVRDATSGHATVLLPNSMGVYDYRGLHSRPSEKLVKILNRFIGGEKERVFILSESFVADGSNMLEIMNLDAYFETDLQIVVVEKDDMEDTEDFDRGELLRVIQNYLERGTIPGARLAEKTASDLGRDNDKPVVELIRGGELVEVTNARRVGFLGDVHANFDKMKEALVAGSFIDEKGTWIAGHQVLVLVGDLIDRGTKPWETLYYLYALQKEAKQKGGAVVILRGNHEEMFLSLKDKSDGVWKVWEKNNIQTIADMLGIPAGNIPSDRSEIIRALDEKAKKEGKSASFSKIFEWIENLPYAVRVNGKILAVHASPDFEARTFESMLSETKTRKSAQAKSAVVSDREWMMSKKGKSGRRQRPKYKKIEAHLKALSLQYLVFGHMDVWRGPKKGKILPLERLKNVFPVNMLGGFEPLNDQEALGVLVFEFGRKAKRVTRIETFYGPNGIGLENQVFRGKKNNAARLAESSSAPSRAGHQRSRLPAGGLWRKRSAHLPQQATPDEIAAIGKDLALREILAQAFLADPEHVWKGIYNFLVRSLFKYTSVGFAVVDGKPYAVLYSIGKLGVRTEEGRIDISSEVARLKSPDVMTMASPVISRESVLSQVAFETEAMTRFMADRRLAWREFEGIVSGMPRDESGKIILASPRVIKETFTPEEWKQFSRIEGAVELLYATSSDVKSKFRVEDVFYWGVIIHEDGREEVVTDILDGQSVPPEAKAVYKGNLPDSLIKKLASSGQSGALVSEARISLDGKLNLLPETAMGVTGILAGQVEGESAKRLALFVGRYLPGVKSDPTALDAIALVPQDAHGQSYYEKKRLIYDILGTVDWRGAVELVAMLRKTAEISA